MFGTDFFERLPPYFTQVEKDRLAEALKQFYKPNESQISYDSFYIDTDCDYLMQSDFIQPLQAAVWSDFDAVYETTYLPAVLLSNTCDLSEDNERALNVKHALFAPVIRLSLYIETLKEAGKSDAQIKGFLSTLERQDFSNLIFFPPFDKTREEYGYVVFLDKVFYRPTSSLIDIYKNLQGKRIKSLSHFGFYLFLLKTINHFGRLPEELEKRSA